MFYGRRIKSETKKPNFYKNNIYNTYKKQQNNTIHLSIEKMYNIM